MVHKFHVIFLGRKNTSYFSIKTSMDTQNDGPWQRWFLFNIAIFGIYVKFLECNDFSQNSRGIVIFSCYSTCSTSLSDCMHVQCISMMFFFYRITKHSRYLKWRKFYLYKLYGYGLCRENHGKSTPQNSLTGFSTSILMIRLVVQKSGKHQLIWYISQYLQDFSLAPSQVVGKGISEPSTVESTVHPGRSTWFTYKSPIFERNMDLPGLHDYVPR